MKHPYSITCECPRCTKERTRRDGQSMKDARSVPVGHHFDHEKHTIVKDRKPRRNPTRQPEWGSAEWAETRGDDLGESPDY